MRNVQSVLGLTGMKVLDLPDGGLKFLDPRVVENEIKKTIKQIKPHILVTYAVHGISGFHDHLVTHACVKRVFCELIDKKSRPVRLALFTVNEVQAKQAKKFNLIFSTKEEINCIVKTTEEDINKAFAALDCYKTYSEVIAESKIKDMIKNEVYFEIFGERFKRPIKDLCEKLSRRQ